jgi:hypothetical protein
MINIKRNVIAHSSVFMKFFYADMADKSRKNKLSYSFFFIIKNRVTCQHRRTPEEH